MNEHAQDSGALLASAQVPGEPIVPQGLLDAVGRLPSPLEFLVAIEPEAGPFEAFREDYPALHLRRWGARALGAEEIEQAAGLLRWMLGELATWTQELDPRLDKAAAILVLLNEFAWDDAQWALLPDGSVSLEWIELFLKILKNYNIGIHGEPGQRRSGSIDVVTELVKADNESDWVAISGYWQQIVTWLPGGGLLGLTLPCLARFEMSGLAAVIDEISQIQTAYFVAGSLSEANRLRLARASISDRYRFAALLSISWGDHVFTGLGDEVENELAALLEKVSQNAAQWTRWMQAFNEYPIRFPALQRPLGRALAQAPEWALAAYVDSISLGPSPLDGFRFRDPSKLDGRQSVALCLNAFRDTASAGQRLGLWGLAHTRWTSWAFNHPSMPGNRLTGIVGSELDFAITAHAAENLSPVERDAQLTSLTNAIRDIEMSWYSSFSELIGRRNFLLSTLQPLLAVNEPDWLYERPVVPKQLVEDPYTRQKYKT